MSEMDDGLKFFRSILAVEPIASTPGGGKEARMRGRVDQFTATLMRNGYTSEQASEIATNCAKKEDRRK
jgi:hypothetical protein